MNRTASYLSATCAAIIMSVGIGFHAVAAEPYYEVPADYPACTDESYENAIENGVKLGVAAAMPWSGIDPASGKAVGIDVELHAEVLKHMGITKITYEAGAFNSLIPSMLSNRIDMVVTDLHVTPERSKTIAFSGPVWWYGPAVVVQAGNPKKVKSFEDLATVRVGVLLGTGTDEYLKKVGIEATRFQSYAEEFAAIQQDKVDVVVEYDLLAAEFKKANPDANVESLASFPIPDDLLKNGYGYARFGFRKEDCSFRAAFNQALAEARASGAMSEVLRRNGLSDRNLFYFPLQVN
ncbi:transporter substrate-binding domain-containing protein [Shinella sp. G-2]|uniref:transporter substrate-binding domain-containing protein n=1 Tax=Rhizobiaceae TaxID=82115 RepID=UPI003CFEB559